MCMFVCLDFKDSSDSKSRSRLQDSICQGLLMPVKLKLISKKIHLVNYSIVALKKLDQYYWVREISVC